MVVAAVVRSRSSNPRKQRQNLPWWRDRTDFALSVKAARGRRFRAQYHKTSAVTLNVCRRCRAIYRHEDDAHGRTADLCSRCFTVIAGMRREEWPNGWSRAKLWEHTYTILVAKLYLRDYAEWKKGRG